MTEKPSSSHPSKGPRKARPGEVYRLRNQEVIVPKGYLAVGRIVGVHGLRGEVKVELHTDFPDRFAPGVTMLLGVDLEEIVIRQVRPHKNQVLLLLEGVTDRSAAERLRDRWLFVDEADAAELDDGEYWIHDIIGLQVATEEGQSLGQVIDILPTGANDVYIIRPAAGINRGQEVLLPAIADVIIAVDLKAGAITVRLPDGLLDD